MVDRPETGGVQRHRKIPASVLQFLNRLFDPFDRCLNQIHSAHYAQNFEFFGDLHGILQRVDHHRCGNRPAARLAFFGIQYQRHIIIQLVSNVAFCANC